MNMIKSVINPPKCFLQDALYCRCTTEPIVHGVIHGQHTWPSTLYTKMHYIRNDKYFKIYCHFVSV